MEVARGRMTKDEIDLRLLRQVGEIAHGQQRGLVALDPVEMTLGQSAPPGSLSLLKQS